MTPPADTPAGGAAQAHQLRIAALVDSLARMPQAMRDRRQWLLWRLEEVPGREGLQKVPYYATGRKRGGELGGMQDRAALATLDTVCKRVAGHGNWSGVGFAFVDGDGLIGIDLDWKHNDSGLPEDHHTMVMDACPSYTEYSPSGKGVHIIVSGQCDSFKSDAIGVEVYCGGRYFTCTGDVLAGTSTEVLPIKPFALDYLTRLVQGAKDQAKQARRAAAQPPADAAAPGRPAPPPVARHGGAPGQQGSDFRTVNDEAYRALHAWVPAVLPAAQEWRNGYRISSKALGRDLQEDLQLLPEGIMDFGEEQGMSPVDVVLKWLPGMSRPKDALEWLAGRLGITLQRWARRPAPACEPAPAARAATPAEPEAAALSAPVADQPPADEPAPFQPLDELVREADRDLAAAAAAPPAAKDAAAASGSNVVELRPKGGKGKAKKAKPAHPDTDAVAPDAAAADDDASGIDWDKFKYLRDNFALIYGTDTVWDGEHHIIMKIANMAHAHGSQMVKLWKGGQASWQRTGKGRWTVLPQNVVFDPGCTCDPETHVNLYSGFPTEARPGDVGPFLELAKFLVSRAADTEEGVDEILHYLLCCMAWPLQHKGAKLRTAVVMHGDEGAGKNFLTDTLVMIYGKYGTTVGQDELEDKFNDYRSGKLILVGDEVSSRAELVHNKNRLKALITSPTVMINPKNLPRREEANHINVWFNSNELQPLALDNSDRRYLVIYTPRAREREFYKRLGEWRDADGVAHLYHYLLNYDCTPFDPFAPAPDTAAKQELIDLNRKSPERFWLEWSAGQLSLPYRSCTLQQAYAAYLKYAQRTGDRFPVQRPLFTRMLLRISDTMGKPCQDKVMNVDYQLRTNHAKEHQGDIRSTRMLLVIPVPPEVPMGVFATDAWRTFEPELRRYLGKSTGILGDDDDDEGTA